MAGRRGRTRIAVAGLVAMVGAGLAAEVIAVDVNGESDTAKESYNRADVDCVVG